jgi:hypothetical protein
MNDPVTYHFPPELFALLVDALPALSRSKADLLSRFRGAGVPNSALDDIGRLIAADPNSISKREITRRVLERLNEAGGSTVFLRARRELLRRIVETEDFTSCYPDQTHKAEALVARIRKVIDVKDAFTRMVAEKDRVEAERREASQQRAAARATRTSQLHKLHARLIALFAEANPWRRGKALEGVLNDIFRFEGIQLDEAFTLKGREGEGIVEQIDGVIRIDGIVYLVEMKWHDGPIGPEPVGYHFSRIMTRAGAGGMFISASGVTDATVRHATEFLHQRPFVLIELRDIVLRLEREERIEPWLRAKVARAVSHKDPNWRP